MAIFRFIFSIIFSPIRWLANSLTQRKDNILEWHLNYGPSFVKIDNKKYNSVAVLKLTTGNNFSKNNLSNSQKEAFSILQKEAKENHFELRIL